MIKLLICGMGCLFALSSCAYDQVMKERTQEESFLKAELARENQKKAELSR